MIENKIYDCIIIGDGPGGLRAAIYLCRYNRNVLILDGGGAEPSTQNTLKTSLPDSHFRQTDYRDRSWTGYALRHRVSEGKGSQKQRESLRSIYKRQKNFLLMVRYCIFRVMDNLPDIENLY